ncbi:MAG: CAP domain-containing protein, partial [Methanoregula sp.]|nr:CAP domain-containing protein [Methanoregula sp.]
HYFAHVNPAGQDPTSRATADGYTCRKTYGSYYTYGIAENLFQNNLYSSATFYNNRETVYNWNSPEAIAQTTVAGWMNSSGHKKNILTRTFDREGIGVAIASEKVYITENFC